MAPNTKCENALKHAEAYIKIGEKASAIQCLFDSIESNKNKLWSNIVEDVIDLLLQLCIDLQESDSAKEALSQYRNICQTINPSSMTTVVNRFLDSCLAKVFSTIEEYKLDSVCHLDLESDANNDIILRNFIMGETEQQRIEREILFPWMKYYWDNIRNILDILKNNNTLEELYHLVCQRAFDFCIQYNRANEFRSLCRRSLRKHLEFLMNNSADAGVKFRIVWSPATAEMQLKTRFLQLETAFKLNLWSEAFNSLNDICAIISANNCKPSMMSTYYEKLIQLFWLSNNYFYHACSQMRLYNLHKKQNKAVTEEELRAKACQVVLSVLCVPTYSIADDESHPSYKIEREREQSIRRLLNLSSHHTRDSLHTDMKAMDVLSIVPQELKELYTVLEEEFHPLDMVNRVKGCLAWMENKEEYSHYLPQLRRMILLRVLSQFEEVYSVMKMENYTNIITSLGFDRYEAERLIVKAGCNNQLHIRLNYTKQCVYFKQHVAERDAVSSYLSPLSTKLAIVMSRVNPENHVMEDRDVMMYDCMDTAKSAKKDILLSMLERSKKIEQEKMEIDRMEKDKNMTEAERVKRESEEREKKEKLRLEEEERKRLTDTLERNKKMEEARQRVDISTKLKVIMGRKYDAEFVESMTLDELRAYAMMEESKAEEAKREKIKKDSEKQLFYARAIREAVYPSMISYFEEGREKAIAYQNASYDNLCKQRSESKAYYDLVMPIYEKMESSLKEYARRVEERRVAVISDKIEERYQAAKERKKKEEEERKKREEERKREEEERKRREEEERKKREEERKLEEEKKKLEEERKKEEDERFKMMVEASSSDEEVKPKKIRRAPRTAPKRNETSTSPVAAPAPKVESPIAVEKPNNEDEWTEVKKHSHKAPPSRR